MEQNIFSQGERAITSNYVGLAIGSRKEDHPKAEEKLQIAKECDILIGAFWTRIGTDAGFAESRTIEQIKEFQKAGKR